MGDTKAHPVVNRTALEPLAQARVLYNPETQVLIIENGQSSEIAEEMAQDVVVFYDEDDDFGDGGANRLRRTRTQAVHRLSARKA